MNKIVFKLQRFAHGEALFFVNKGESPLIFKTI